MKSIEPLLVKTQKAAIQLRNNSDKQLKSVLLKLADALEENMSAILNM